MDCGIIDECRCYKYKGAKNQFCGARRGPTVRFFTRDYLFGFFMIITLLFLVFHDLKIKPVR